jgi:hypothetical protein
VEIIEHVLHRSEHQLLFGDDRRVEVAITATARLLFHHEALIHKIADRDRNRADGERGGCSFGFLL